MFRIGSDECVQANMVARVDAKNWFILRPIIAPDDGGYRWVKNVRIRGTADLCICLHCQDGYAEGETYGGFHALDGLGIEI